MKEVMNMENYDELLKLTQEIQTTFYAYYIDYKTKAQLAGNIMIDTRPEKVNDKLIELRDKLQLLVDKQNREIREAYDVSK